MVKLNRKHKAKRQSKDKQKDNAGTKKNQFVQNFSKKGLYLKKIIFKKR